MLGVKPSSLEQNDVYNVSHNAVVLRVNNKSVKALIDSGASRSFISENFLSTLGIPFSALKTSDMSSLVAASGHPLPIVGTILLNVNIQCLSIPTTFHVLRNLLIKCVLGVNFLQDSGALLNCAKKTLSLYDGLVCAQLISNFDRDSILLLSKSVIIPPRSETYVPVRVHGKYVGKRLITESWPPLKNRMIIAANALIEPHVNKSYCHVV